LESLLTSLLPMRHRSFVFRYAFSTALLLLSTALRLGLGSRVPDESYILFIPAVFLSALLFDRAVGYWATALATLLAAGVFMQPYFSLIIQPDDTIPLVLFIVTCIGLVEITDALRRVLDRVSAAEQENALLLRELDHRTRNNLQMMASVLALQASGSRDPQVQDALNGAVARVQVIARAHESLQQRGTLENVQLDRFLENLCGSLGELLRDIRPIAITVEADPIGVPTRVAVAVGLLANELVTNAFKYAFPNGAGGTIQVLLRQNSEGRAELAILDDGVGFSAEAPQGLGTRLTSLLARQLNGTIERRVPKTGSMTVVSFPLGELRA
jgi:two-component sensor histidine kinase